MVYTFRLFQNAVCFIILTCLFPVLFTFFYTGCTKIKKNNSGAKRLIICTSYKFMYKKEKRVLTNATALFTQNLKFYTMCKITSIIEIYKFNNLR